VTGPAQRVAALADAVVLRWLAVPRVLRWLPVAAVVGALWWSSSRTPVATEPSVVAALLHNAMHVVAFAILGATVWCAAHTPGRGDGRLPTAAAVAFAIAYGIVDELHQSQVPGRVASAWDVLSDACGGVLAAWLLHRRLVVARSDRTGALCIAVASCVSVALATFG
jgi:VanZ family protein